LSKINLTTTSSLTKLYSWEPRREDEIELLMKDFSVDKIAMFYSLRPYFSIVRNRKVNNPEVVLDKFIKSRTNYKNIKGVFNSWEELDKMWKQDFASIDWRNYSNEKGYFPEGYLFEIWNGANMTRDNHLVQTITQLVKEGKTVFATMGVSHAPRIEKSLKHSIEQL